MSRLGFDVRGISHSSALGALVLLLLCFFQLATGAHMLSASNLQNIIVGNAHVVVLAIGMVMVVTIGQLDLSVGAVAGFSSMFVALALAGTGLPWWLGLAGGLAIGGTIGAIHGFFVARIGLPAFIVTVGSMIILRGALLWGSQTLSVPVPGEFTYLGAGHLSTWGRFVGVDVATLIVGLVFGSMAIVRILRTHFRRRARFDLGGHSIVPWLKSLAILLLVVVFSALIGRGRLGASIPVPGVIILALVAVYHFVSVRTAFGLHLKAAGGDAHAAALSGVRVKRIQMLVMVNMGMLSALAGILFAGRSTAAGPQDGLLWELDAIAAVFIGGAAVAGGRGSIVGAVLGACLMAVLSNGLLLVGVGSDGSQIIKGLVLLTVVTLDAYLHRDSPLRSLVSKPQLSF